MDQHVVNLSPITVSPAAVGAQPALQEQLISARGLLKSCYLRVAGTWDQSVGAESQATEGPPVLLDDIRLNLGGSRYRFFPGPVLYELNRILNKGALAKVSPAVGVAAGKAFSFDLDLNMGFLDIIEDVAREQPYLDLNNYANVSLQIQPATFSKYVSGNTQANITYTIAPSLTIIDGPRRLPQQHFHALPSSTVDMSVTGVGRKLAIDPAKKILRGLLFRVGTFSTTPVVTAMTALTNIGIKGTRKVGGTQVLWDYPTPVSLFQSLVGSGRNGITLTAGYILVDFVSHMQADGLLIGNKYQDLTVTYDVVGTANTQMTMYELIEHRG